ncbi:MAG TPA: TIM44-like domain-containing protein [Albitalea sp.]|uniref:Tim44 domain-containing protein n=1 Tax=Piscinibacter sp. TaxID=1903157 RepID=UPI002ED11EE9
MKRIVLSAFIALLGLGFTAHDVEAKRLGGGLSQGIKRQAPAPRQDPATPPQQATPSPTQQPAATPGTAGAAAAQAAAPRRSWLGPVAGLAAGLGLAALMSHLGFGAEFANILTMLLLAVLAVWLVRFLMRRFAPAPQARSGLQFAGGPQTPVWRDEVAPQTPSLATPVTAPRPALPAGFDSAEFERAAKTIFIRMQAANDAGNLDDLRQFATPEMFAAFRLDLQDRAGRNQRTDVVKLDAEVLDWAEENGQQIASVRYHGLIREEQDSVAAPFDEVWHLMRPADASRGWAIAGIAQLGG